MNKKITRKQAAFSIGELLIVITIISFFIIITSITTLNTNKINQNQITISSKMFYNRVVSVYRTYLDLGAYSAVSNGENSEKETALTEFLIEYLDGERMECTDKYFKTLAEEKGENCVFFPSGIIAKIYYNPEELANIIVDKKDFYMPEDELAEEVEKATGYITYTFKNAIGAFGKDTFRITFDDYDILP